MENPFCTPLSVNTTFGTGNNVPQLLCVPILAYEPDRILLTWSKPDKHDNIVDYNIYKNGQKLGSAKDNSIKNSVIGKYFDTFLKEDPEFYPNINFDTFLVTGLNAQTQYKFTVRSVDSNGQESVDSKELIVTTPFNYKNVIDITDLGAVGDGKTLNTKVIQKAIDQCIVGSNSAFDCKVHIPQGTFLTGGLILHSNMTLELASGAILLGSPHSSDYPLLQRLNMPSALINDPLHSHNIRIIGNGIIDGSGWKQDTTISDEIGNSLPVYVQGNSKTVSQLGILAKDQVEQSGGNYGTSRSTLALLLGITSLHIGGNLIFRNPAMITIAIGNCKDVVNFIKIRSKNDYIFSVINNRFHTFDINNGDGMNIGASSNIQILNNFFETGDDAIAMGTGQGARSSSPPVEGVVIRNNYFRHSHGCSFGGYTGDFIQDVLIEDNIFILSNNGLRMKATPETGGGVRRVVFRNAGLKAVGSWNSFTYNGKTLNGNTINGNPLIFTLQYGDGKNSFPPAKIPTIYSYITINDVSVDGISSKTGKAGSMILIDGNSQNQYFHNNFVFKNLNFKNIIPATISQLKSSTFDSIQVNNFEGSSTFSFKQCNDLTFNNVPSLKNSPKFIEKIKEILIFINCKIFKYVYLICDIYCFILIISLLTLYSMESPHQKKKKKKKKDKN
ncbi:Fibronectin type-III domain-containing protein [Meloidogyne graminicola]|uniref:Fibronectin type-III domain-containing protein n=1 Tax=Meloidogyne graminicola TaxID=189291 RepID=A0A8T0A456_9BILA|nr:Fibronectin type-III domain-containing protein [Meloidogyne graminicola]